MVDEYTDESVNDGGRVEETDPLGIIGTALVRKYQIEKYIGRGGFGHVYLASNIELFQQRVVVKFLVRPEAIDRFRLEAAIQANLDHPNICGVQAYLPDQKAIVIPYIDGSDCERLLRESGPFSEKRVMDIALSLAKALVYAHGNEVTHRDLKPSNIMIDRHGHVRLIDFGIAKRTSHQLTDDRPTPGTWTYIPPEQLDDDAPDDPVQRDIYAFGVTLFQLATGVRLRRERLGDSPNHWGGEAARRLSPGFRNFLRRLTEPEQEERFTSMQEALEVLESLPSPHGPGRRWRVALLLAVPLVVAGLYYFSGVAGPERDGSPRDTVNNSRLSGEGLDSARAGGPLSAHGDLNRRASKATDSAVAIEADSSANAGKDADEEETSSDVASRSSGGAASPIHDEPDESNRGSQETGPGEGNEGIGLIAASGGVGLPLSDSISFRAETYPDKWIAMEFDGRRIQSDRPEIRTIPGLHKIQIVHARYPIFEEVVYLDRDTVLAVNAASDFAQVERVDLVLGCVPYPTSPTRLTVRCNGIERKFDAIPARIRSIPAGKWSVVFEMERWSGESWWPLAVDSFVVKQSSLHRSPVFAGDSAVLDLGLLRGVGRDNVKIVIYWTRDI